MTADLFESRDVQDELLHGEARVEARRLRQLADPATDHTMIARFSRLYTADPNRTGVRTQRGSHRSQQARLPGSIGPEQSSHSHDDTKGYLPNGRTIPVSYVERINF